MELLNPDRSGFVGFWVSEQCTTPGDHGSKQM